MLESGLKQLYKNPESSWQQSWIIWQYTVWPEGDTDHWHAYTFARLAGQTFTGQKEHLVTIDRFSWASMEWWHHQSDGEHLIIAFTFRVGDMIGTYIHEQIVSKLFLTVTSKWQRQQPTISCWSPMLQLHSFLMNSSMPWKPVYSDQTFFSFTNA